MLLWKSSSDIQKDVYPMHVSVILGYAATLLGKTWQSVDSVHSQVASDLGTVADLNPLMVRGGAFGIVRSMLSWSFRAQRQSGSVPTNLNAYQIQNLENQRTAYAAWNSWRKVNEPLSR